MTVVRLSLLVGSALLALGACAPKAPPPVTPEPTADFGNNPYCPNGVLLCSALPGEQIPVPQGCASFDQQCSRDFQSWQNFVSLNWPGKILPSPGLGIPIVVPDSSASVGGAGDRVWELWMDPDSVFLPGAVEPTWAPGGSAPVNCGRPLAAGAKGLLGRLAKAAISFDLERDAFFTATIGQPLIDQNLNFVVFEIRMNQQEVGWVTDNRLYQRETVRDLKTTLNLPGDAIETKAAWRILPANMPEAQKNRYYRRMATIVLDPSHVQGATGPAPVCLERELGLIGLHIRHQGLWSTFEQVDNVTASVPGITPTLYNPTCSTCATNVPPKDPSGNPIPPANYKWSLTGPSAQLYRNFPNVPAQITYAPGQGEYINSNLNIFWQRKVLIGTVWANYRLITTNWIEELSSQPVPALNTSLEPFVPPVTTLPQACIDCHKAFATVGKAGVGQTFLPFRACPVHAKPGEKLPPNCLIGGFETLAAGAVR